MSLGSRQSGGSDASQLSWNQKWVLVQTVNCSLYVVQRLACKVGIAVFQEPINEHQNVAEAEDTAFTCWQVAPGLFKGFMKGV